MLVVIIHIPDYSPPLRRSSPPFAARRRQAHGFRLISGRHDCYRAQRVIQILQVSSNKEGSMRFEVLINIGQERLVLLRKVRSSQELVALPSCGQAYGAVLVEP